MIVKRMRAIFFVAGLFGLFSIVSCESKATVKSEPAQPVEILQNGSFANLNEIQKNPIFDFVDQTLIDKSTKAGYWLLLAGAGPFKGDASATVEKGVCKIHLVDPGTELYSIQLTQTPILIQKDKNYTVTFEAKADAPKKIFSKISMVGGDYRAYSGDQYFELTTEMKTYSYTFTPFSTDKKARLEFNLGQTKGDVYISKVSIMVK
jgi:hypothetical protein